jgi:hypothetical protein
MTVRELRERLACEPDDAVVEVYREGGDAQDVAQVTGVDGYDVGPTGTGAVVLTIELVV